LAAVGERVRRDVHYPHDQAPARPGQAREGPGRERHRVSAGVRRSLLRSLPRPIFRAVLRASRRSSTRGQTRKASASSAASAILGTSVALVKTKNRGCQGGLNLALNLYSDSIGSHLEAKISTERQALSTGPAPIRSPRS